MLSIDVNSLTSIDNIVPYPFYSLKFCRPTREMREERLAEEKLGEVLWGDHIEPSMYLVEMMTNLKCKPLACREENGQMSRADLKMFERRINAPRHPDGHDMGNEPRVPEREGDS
eukprot:gene13537-2134_t